MTPKIEDPQTASVPLWVKFASEAHDPMRASGKSGFGHAIQDFLFEPARSFWNHPFRAVLEPEVFLGRIRHEEFLAKEIDFFQVRMQAYWDLNDRPLVDTVVNDSVAGPVHLGAGFLQINAQIEFVFFNSCFEAVLLEDVSGTPYQFLGKTVQADHRTDVQVIVPFDEGVIPHSA